MLKFSDGNVRLVQEILGHSDVTTMLRTYTHVLEGMRKELPSKMDEFFEGSTGVREPVGDEGDDSPQIPPMGLYEESSWDPPYPEARL